jgi:hypothetical protein
VKAEAGPAGGPVAADASPSAGLGDGADTLGEGDGALVMGGGSMDECEVGGFEGITGSGREGISSSMLEVSMVICLVGGAVWRRV